MKILNLITILFLLNVAEQPTFNSKIKHGEITYSVYISNFDKSVKKDANKEVKEQINQANDEIVKIQFLLKFDDTQSIFEVINKLTVGNDNQNLGLQIANAIVGTTDKYYKNTLLKEKLKFTEKLGEKIIYDLPYKEFEWILTNESKKINGLLCYKAYTKVKQLNEVTNIVKTFQPTAWYCPSIPLSYGPRGVDGLPGLVLEASFNGKVTFVVDKIDFNIKPIIKNNVFNGKRTKRIIYEKDI